MRAHVERLVMFPFSLGCDSESSAAVVVNNIQPNKIVAQDHHHHHHLPITTIMDMNERRGKGGMRSLRVSTKKSSLFQGLIRRFMHTFSQLFVQKEMELEKEMEIGFPTDVKHVTHIGWDGSTTTNPMFNNWETPSISLTQFHLALAAQAAALPLPDHLASCTDDVNANTNTITITA